MGFAFIIGPCHACGGDFTYNPMKVPSIRVKGVRKPICGTCMALANADRKKRGIEPHVIHPEAYEACDEAELP